MDESPEKASRRRRLRRLSEPQAGRPKSLLLLVVAGISFFVLLCFVVAVFWDRAILEPEERIAELEQWQPEPEIQDPELDKARELYGRALELMSRRRFDEAEAVVEEARKLHFPLLKKYEKHPLLSKLIEGQERELCHQERLLSEKATEEDLRALALESQKRMREENLRNALSKAEELCKEGKFDEAIDILTKFAEQHKDFDVGQKALDEVKRLKERAVPTSE